MAYNETVSLRLRADLSCCNKEKFEQGGGAMNETCISGGRWGPHPGGVIISRWCRDFWYTVFLVGSISR